MMNSSFPAMFGNLLPSGNAFLVGLDVLGQQVKGSEKQRDMKHPQNVKVLEQLDKKDYRAGRGQYGQRFQKKAHIVKIKLSEKNQHGTRNNKT
jgi:hypothetical protein